MHIAATEVEQSMEEFLKNKKEVSVFTILVIVDSINKSPKS